MENVKRCKWCNLKNPVYVKYHDEEWGRPNFDEKYLFEMLILESFQAGLSWECVLNKRKDFKEAYDNFNIDKICKYDDKKIKELLSNEKLIRNKLNILFNVLIFSSSPFPIFSSSFYSFNIIFNITFLFLIFNSTFLLFCKYYIVTSLIAYGGAFNIILFLII